MLRDCFFVPCALLCAALLLDASTATAAPADAPNVIVILADDLGSVDAGCYGSQDLITPAIDRLAEQGVRFTQFYAASSVCSPSRAGLLTGRYPRRNGVEGNVPGELPESIERLTELTGPRHPIADQQTMAEMFKAAGYGTAHVGKWHLTVGPGARPLEQGFDYSFGHMNGCIDNFSHFFYWIGPNRHDLWENNDRVRLPGQYFPDLVIERATAFIDQPRDAPFFMYMAINLPHYPYQGDPKWLKRYANLPMQRRLYAAFVSTLDERIGRLLSHLEARGLGENTIVVFQSDNGHSTEERAHGGGGSAGPYRGAKGCFFEGGMRLPAIIRWPGKLPAGEVRAQMAHGCDWLPTLAELTGVELLEEDLDGRSLVPVLRSADAPSPHTVLDWKLGKQWAVREGDWKLLGNAVDTSEPERKLPPLTPADKQLFLVNLANDPGETQNVAAEYPDIVRRLQRLHQQAVDAP